jgi:hypothetical protein
MTETFCELAAMPEFLIRGAAVCERFSFERDRIGLIDKALVECATRPLREGWPIFFLAALAQNDTPSPFPHGRRSE